MKCNVLCLGSGGSDDSKMDNALTQFFHDCPDMFVIFLTLCITVVGIFVFPFIFQSPSSSAKKPVASSSPSKKKKRA